MSLHFHPLKVREIRPDTEEATIVSFDVPEDLPENVYVTFADEDPVRVDCQDGRVRLTIRLKELEQEGTRNRWTNFTVRAYYAPSADQLDANLYRDGIIELIGDNRPLPIGQRAALSRSGSSCTSIDDRLVRHPARRFRREAVAAEMMDRSAQPGRLLRGVEQAAEEPPAEPTRVLRRCSSRRTGAGSRRSGRD